MKTPDIKHSKFLSLILRHQPEKIGVALDPQGWIAVEVLLEALARHRHPLSPGELENIVVKATPPRLPEQPIFYPVMNRVYAALYFANLP